MHCPTPCSCALKLLFFHPWSPVDCSRDSGTVESGAPPSPGVAYGLKGAATDLLRSLGAVDGTDEPHASQAFKLTRLSILNPGQDRNSLTSHLSHPYHVPTLCSALVDRVAQNGICGPIFPWCFGLQRCFSMPPHGLGMACKWERQRTLRRRSRSVE